MKVIRPLTYDESTMLVSTTATETVSAWSSGSTYSENQEVLFDDYIWVSLKGSNNNKQPDLYDLVAQSDSADQWWRRKQPDNQSAMFVTNVSTQTVDTNTLTAVIDTGEYINAVLLKNLLGASVQVTAVDTVSTDTIFDSGVVSIDEAAVGNWYEYFFEDSNITEQVLFTGIPPYKTTRLTITITGTGTVGIGIAVMGNIYDLGDATLGSSVGIIDFSTKETDTFGNTTFTERGFADTLSTNVRMERGTLAKTKRVLTELRATPAAWILSEAEGMSTFGWLRDFSIGLEAPTYVIASLEIEGLI